MDGSGNFSADESADTIDTPVSGDVTVPVAVFDVCCVDTEPDNNSAASAAAFRAATSSSDTAS